MRKYVAFKEGCSVVFVCLFQRSLRKLWASLLAQTVRIHLQDRWTRFNSWIGKIFWRREWLPTPVYLHRESHGQRSLIGYSPWGCKELDTTEWLTLLLRMACTRESFKTPLDVFQMFSLGPCLSFLSFSQWFLVLRTGSDLETRTFIGQLPPAPISSSLICLIV